MEMTITESFQAPDGLMDMLGDASFESLVRKLSAVDE
jgi:hypothetical protein